MKITVVDDKIVIYLNSFYTSNLNFDDKDSVNSFFKQFLNRLHKSYDFDFDGYFNIILYVDRCYGVIVEISKEELQYFDYFSSQTEMNIEVNVDDFLYEVYDFDNFFDESFDVYKVYDKMYLRAKGVVSDVLMGKLLEFSKIIYGDAALAICKVMKEVV